MKYDIQVIQCSRDAIELTLKTQANQGWQLVSCWPEADQVIGVFQCPLPNNVTAPAKISVSEKVVAPKNVTAAPASTKTNAPTKSVVPATSAAKSSTCSKDSILKSVISVPIKAGKPHHILAVKTLADASGVGSEEMLKALKNLGLEVEPIVHQGHQIWLYKGKSA